MKGRKSKEKKIQNNKTLDQFFKKPPPSSSKQKSQIQVPPSSGYQPYYEPLHLPLLYPEYPEFRDYQFQIVQQCVVKNSLVCLPTGLGKTHIASIVMLNYYRWFPDGKIFFIAPTRPLVEQQIQCLFKFNQIISLQSVSTVRAELHDQKRKHIYEKKRVFFCTPQILQNDIKAERIDRNKIVLIIFDQAHKAIGNYAYTQVVKLMEETKYGYRIVGLSATPGNEKEKIQEVIQNILVSKMIIKQEQDENVAKYCKGKKTSPVYIAHSEIIREVQSIMNGFIKPCMTLLKRFQVADQFLLHAKNISRGLVFMITTKFKERANNYSSSQKNTIWSTLNFLHYLVSEKDSLREFGYFSFVNKFVKDFSEYEKFTKEEQCSSSQLGKKIRFGQKQYQLIIKSEGWKRIKSLFSNESKIQTHPKLQKLRDLLVSFLNRKESIENKSKVIIFATFRSTCFEIKQYLDKCAHQHLIRAEMFFGQAKTTIDASSNFEENSNTHTLQLSQKDQIKLIQNYKDNVINVLISTSIGEQGLDIGEVDAIFCYDGGMSNIRMIQRMGRTGRKRDGSVFLLLMEGKQSQDYHKALKKKGKIQKISQKDFKFYCYNPTMLSESQVPIQFFSKSEGCEDNLSSNRSSQKKERKKRTKSKAKPKQQQTQSCSQILAKNEKNRNSIIDSYSSELLCPNQAKKYFKVINNTNCYSTSYSKDSKEDYEWEFQESSTPFSFDYSKIEDQTQENEAVFSQNIEIGSSVSEWDIYDQQSNTLPDVDQKQNQNQCNQSHRTIKEQEQKEQKEFDDNHFKNEFIPNKKRNYEHESAINERQQEYDSEEDSINSSLAIALISDDEE